MKNITATYKGLITGGLMIVVCLLYYVGFKIPFNSTEQYAILTLYAAGIVWSLLSFNSTATKETKFKEYFQAGFKTFIVITLLMVVYCICYYVFDTSMRDTWISNNNQALLKEGNHMPSEIEGNAKQMRTMWLPMMTGICLFKNLIIGVIVTVITAGFFSQKKNSF